MVVEAVNDVLVVVDADIGGFVEAGLLGCLEIADIKDVGDGVLIGGWAGEFLLIDLVVKEEEFLPVLVVDPTLMGVCGSLVLEMES